MTSFNTIDGQIVDQIDSLGNVTEYMFDGLGSITGTTDSFGNGQNVYRWAPYGTEIVKAGTASDPQFQWVGTLGYRYTGRAHASWYVRARHYGQEQASWTTIDAYWPSLRAYGYSKSRPVLLADPSGMQPTLNATSSYQFLNKQASAQDCGAGGVLTWLFTMTGVPSGGGWIIQQVKISLSGSCCSNPQATLLPTLSCKIPCQPQKNGDIVYYEAFKVTGDGEVGIPEDGCNKGWGPPGSTPNGKGYSDIWPFNKQSCIRNGSATISATQYWFDGKTAPFTACDVCGSGNLPSTCTYAPSGTALGTTTASYTSTCCSLGNGTCPGNCGLVPKSDSVTCNSGKLCWSSGGAKTQQCIGDTGKTS
jgi:hypothetical protein